MRKRSVAIGKLSSIWNSTRDASVKPLASSPTPFAAWSIAVVPKTVNQIMLTATGMSRTAAMNSRIVLPFEMRAINIPTNGDQEIHHAQ